MRVKSTLARHVAGILLLLWQWPFRCIAILLLLAVVALSSLTALRKLETFVDVALETHAESVITQNLLEILALIVIYAITTSLREYIVRRLTDDTVAELFRRAYRSVLFRPVAYFENNSPGALVGRITADTEEFSNFVDFIFSVLLRNVLILIGGGILMYRINAELVYYSAMLIPAVLCVLIVTGKHVGRRSLRVQNARAALSSRVTETFNAIETIKVFNNEKYRETRIQSAIDELISTRRALNFIQAIMTGLLVVLCMGAVACIVWLGVLRVIDGHLSAGSLVSFLGILLMVAFAAASLGDSYTVLIRASVAYSRLLELDTTAPERVKDSSLSIIKQSNLTSIYPVAIEFRAVQFSYPSRAHSIVIDTMNLKIKKNAFVAFVGRSGEGKSTLIKLMLRLYPVTRGEIIINGMQLSNMDIEKARSYFSVVTQSPHLFSGSLLENITLGNDQIPESKLNEILKLTAVDRIVEKLNEGLHSSVGEQGVRLSGGERQRIAIARALLRDSEILIFDEATCHLDAETERAIQTTINALAGKKTIITIAHHLSSVKRADIIYVIDKGRIVEQGAHGALLAKQGFYTILVKNQLLES